MTKTVDHRFHVCCDECGLIDAYPSLVEAKMRAISATNGSHSNCKRIVIFDSMAHIGKPQLYTKVGSPIEIRGV